MSYNLGETVVMNVYGTYKVGVVAEKIRTVKGERYIVNGEDGNINEDLYIDDSKSVTTFIDSRLTKSFNKAK
tara:strand:- start:270 stop:485 length:216 start_codon:yes stop_codon:yes gene_type:complete